MNELRNAQLGTGGEPNPAAEASTHDDLELMARLLDQLGIGFCVYDAEDRATLWNGTFLDFFPEQLGHMRPGVTYAATLERFFASNLPDAEVAYLDRHVQAGVARYHAQTQPFVFQRRNGRWLKVASLPRGGGGRMRVWHDVTVEHAGPAAGRAAQAVAALDVGYAVFDAGRRFVAANKGYQELFPEIGDLVRPGTHYREHLQRIGRSALMPGEAVTLETVAARATPDQPVSMPQLLRRTSGSWLKLEERRGDDGTLITIWSDATRQAEADARIARLETYLGDAIEAMPHGLLLFDREGRLVLANSRLLAIDADLARRMVLGAPHAAFQDWRHAVAHDPAPVDYDDGSPQDHALADGRWLRVQTLRTGDGDRLVLLSDVTGEKEREAELQRQREAMHQNEKLTALGSLLAGVAHELNNPLSILVGRAGVLQSLVRDPEIAGQVQAIATAAERCARIVKTFLEMARQRPPTRRLVDVNMVLRDVLGLLAYGLRAGGIEVETRLAPDLPQLWADPDQLSQVVINLAVNAQHALAERAEGRRLALRTTATPDRAAVRIEVADNGPGLSLEVRRRLFEPFFTTKPIGAGTGLGLSMSLGLVRAHDGTITVADTPGGGATFLVTLPVVEAPLAVERQAPAPVLPSRPGRRILVVDDEPEIAELLRDVLAIDRHEVTTAHDGHTALVKLAEQRFDLVISDLMMPGLDGQGLWREVARRFGGVPPFIFLTGDSLRAERSVFLRETGCGVILKPFDPSEIRRAVKELDTSKNPPRAAVSY